MGPSAKSAIKIRGQNTNKNRVKAATCYATDKVLERRSTEQLPLQQSIQSQTGRDLFSRIVDCTFDWVTWVGFLRVVSKNEDDKNFFYNTLRLEREQGQREAIRFDKRAVTSNFREMDPHCFFSHFFSARPNTWAIDSQAFYVFLVKGKAKIRK